MSPERRAAVTRARDVWVSRLIDLSRRNRLLYHRDLKTGTLDLTAHDPAAMGNLLRGDSVTLGNLLPQADEAATASCAQEIRRTALANREEKGLETLSIAIGFASWASADQGRPASSPVILAPVAIEKRGREGRTLALKIVGELQINPVLVFALETEHGRQIDPEALLQMREESDQEAAIDPDPILARLESAAAGIKEFQLQRRVVLGNFAFHKMAMVKDLKDNLDALAAQDLIAAIAGDSAARQAVAGSGTEADPKTLDEVPPDNEFLVLDADSSQQAAIASALAGRSGVIIGPPGTGKSQTIANLIAELAARGRRVLFVAEKRAALDVVLNRLQDRGLRHLALDLHGAGITRRAVMAQFSESLSLLRDSQPVDCEELHRTFIERRKRLVEHVATLHQPRPPSGLSAYEMQGRLLHFSADESARTRWRGAELDRLTPAAKDQARGLIIELAGFSDLLQGANQSPWSAARLPDGEAVQLAIDSLGRLRSEYWPRLQELIAALTAESKLPPPATLDDLRSLVGLLNGINLTLARFNAAIFKSELAPLLKALGPAAGRISAVVAWCFSATYRQARKTARHLRKDAETSVGKILRELIMADAQMRRWSGIAATRPPVACAGVTETRQCLDAVIAELKRLTPILGRGELSAHRVQDLGRLIDDLSADSRTPYRMPQFHLVGRRLSEAGAGAIVDEIRRRQPPSPGWPRLLEHAWLSSCLERARLEDPAIGGFDGRVHDRFREEFCRQDQERVVIAASRVLRAHAERVLLARNSFPEQDALVRREAATKSAPSAAAQPRHAGAGCPDHAASLLAGQPAGGQRAYSGYSLLRRRALR